MANVNPVDFSKFLATMAQSAPSSTSLDALQKRTFNKHLMENEMPVDKNNFQWE